MNVNQTNWTNNPVYGQNGQKPINRGSISYVPNNEALPSSTPILTTTLTKPAISSTKKLEVASQNGCEVGMLVVIGNENRKITGFGSIMIDQPLLRAYPSGTTVQVFPATPKNPAVPNNTSRGKIML